MSNIKETRHCESKVFDLAWGWVQVKLRNPRNPLQSLAVDFLWSDISCFHHFIGINSNQYFSTGLILNVRGDAVHLAEANGWEDEANEPGLIWMSQV